jgi:hypothetical protein
LALRRRLSLPALRANLSAVEGWQVKETEQDIQADAGQWWSFTKVTGTTGKLAPLDGTTNHGEDVWVSWSAVADAGYWVCWDTSNNNTCDSRQVTAGDDW